MTAPARPLPLAARESLRAARLAARLSQTQLAAALGVSWSTVTRIERGATPVTLEMIERWAGVCGVEARIEIGPVAP